MEWTGPTPNRFENQRSYIAKLKYRLIYDKVHKRLGLHVSIVSTGRTPTQRKHQRYVAMSYNPDPTF